MDAMRMDYFKSLKLVFLGAVFALAAAVVLIYHLMGTLSGIANEQDVIRSTRAVRAAMHTGQEKLSGVLVDNAIWSDAVLHVTGQPDADWLMRNWGNSLGQGNYDIALVMDPDGSVLWSHSRADLVAPALEGFAHSSAAAFIAGLPKDDSTFGSVIDTFLLNGTPLVVGVVPVVPEKGSETAPANPARFLVFARLVDQAAIDAIAGKIIVSDLHLSSAEPVDPQWSSTLSFPN